MLLEIIFYIFLIALGVQVFYLLLTFIGIFKKSKKTSELKPVSIVIAARNEIENLKVLLPKLYGQQYHDFEIIVVDDQSNDGTEDWAREEEERNSKLRYIRINNSPEHIHTKKYALTIGIKKALNPVILLTDADCFPVSDQWVNEIASRYVGNKKIVLGYSGYTSGKTFLNYFIRFETLLTGLQYLGWAGLGIPYMGIGRNLSYLKRFFQEKKGYKKFQSVMGGDDDLFVNQHAEKDNTAIVTGKNSLVLSYPKTTWSSYYRQKLRHLSVGRFYKKRHKMLLSLFSLTQIFFWVSFLILLLGQNELYFIGFGFLGRLVVISLVLGIASRRFGHPLNITGVILLDFCYTIYYIFVGVAALFSRKTKWS